MSRFRDPADAITARHEDYQTDAQQVRYAINALEGRPQFNERLLTLIQKAITGPDKDTCELGRWLAKEVDAELARQAEVDYWAEVADAKEARAELDAMYRDDAA